MICMFDEETQSNTDRRQALALQRIPNYVEVLLEKLESGEMLDPDDIRVLYAEYRALHRNKTPFRSCVEHSSGKPFHSCRWGVVRAFLVTFQDPYARDRHTAECYLADIYRSVCELRGRLLISV